MKFIVLPFLFAACLAVPEATFNLAGDKYDFNFATGDSGSHTRSESGAGSGSVQGKYSYVDPNGNLREVRYTADATGFHPEGDISVDKKTADDAAAVAALAPKAPEVPVQVQTYAAAPFAYTAGHPFFYGAGHHAFAHPFAHQFVHHGNHYFNRFF